MLFQGLIDVVVVCTKGGLKSESAGGFSIAILNIPFYYPKLLRPVHGIEKLII